MIANVKSTVEQRRVLRNTLPVSWLLFTLLTVQTDNQILKLPTQSNCTTPLKNVILRHHYIMQKNSICIETEQRCLCKLFTAKF